MDPELVLKAIEGYVDVLEPERKALDAFYKQFTCKRCGRGCRKEMVKGHVFGDSGTLNPRCVLRCLACGCLFDPHTGLLLETGNSAQTPEGVPLIRPED